MSKSIPNVLVKALRGTPMRVPKRTDDGDIVWEDREKGIPQLVEADVKRILREVLLNIPKSIMYTNDPMRAAQMWNQMEGSSDGMVELKDKVYEWLDGVLKRQVPPTPQEKEHGQKEESYAMRMWGMSTWLVLNALKDKDAQQSIEDVEPANEKA